jgi:chromosome condensin MukBEF complex kleisin-like MukF subunit
MKNLTAEARKRGGKLEHWARNVWTIFCAALGEVFDESAYERFLKQTCTSRSKESYRAFMHDREAALERKPRCC